MDEYGEEELDADFLVPHYEEVDDLNDKKKDYEKDDDDDFVDFKRDEYHEHEDIVYALEFAACPQLKLEIRII